MLKETPKTLEFLAKSRDRRAIITYNNWMKHIGAPNSMITYEDSKISKEKTIKK